MAHTVLSLSGWSPPKGFGLHPGFLKDAAQLRRNARRSGNFMSQMGKEVSVEELCDPRHPEVTVIPRDRVMDVVDEWRDRIGFQRTWFPFSSTDFYVELDEHEGTVFWELVRATPFFRLGKISQLGYLVPARPEHWSPDIHIAYLTPTFEHTRWIHSFLVAIFMEVTLARAGFSQKERNPVVLTAGCHDIATVAGGDPVKLMDPENLDEEKNFSWVLEHFGLAERWRELFGFDLEAARLQVLNEGTFGLLLDVLDKISYTALDCYHVGVERPGKIRDFCIAHPLVMDAWQDIRFTEDRTRFAFVSPERLYDFLVLRALEHTELLLNPDSRRLDLYLTNLLRPLYESGEIIKEQLLLRDNDWLERELERRFPEKIKGYIEPDLLGWEWFATREERERFCREIGENRVERREDSKPFNPGLYLPVFAADGSIRQLREVLEPDKVETLEQMSRQRSGFCVFYYR